MGILCLGGGASDSSAFYDYWEVIFYENQHMTQVLIGCLTFGVICFIPYFHQVLLFQGRVFTNRFPFDTTVHCLFWVLISMFSEWVLYASFQVDDGLDILLILGSNVTTGFCLFRYVTCWTVLSLLLKSSTSEIRPCLLLLNFQFYGAQEQRIKK